MHRFISKAGIELIKAFEGFSSKPYICAGGYMTIGYGHKLIPSDRFNILSPEKAEKLLLKDLLKIERYVLKYISSEINDNQFSSLVSFTYNLGPAALQRSTLRQKINHENYLEAADEFLKWVYADGKKIHGLVKRRNLERKLFLL